MSSTAITHDPSAAGLSAGLMLLLATGAGLAAATLYYSQPMLGILGTQFQATPGNIGLVPTLTQLGYALGIWLLTLVVFFVALSRQPTGAGGLQPPVRAVIVLGSGTPGGQPSPPLRARLDLALDIAARFPQALVAVSGCVDFGETRSEGQVMGDYLRAKGLAAIRIVQEEASTSTELNLKLSQPVLAARGVGLNDPVVVVTSDFHTWRAQRIAQRQGWQQVQTVGAPTPLYIRYNAWLREYFAIASSTLLGEM